MKTPPPFHGKCKRYPFPRVIYTSSERLAFTVPVLRGSGLVVFDHIETIGWKLGFTVCSDPVDSTWWPTYTQQVHQTLGDVETIPQKINDCLFQNSPPPKEVADLKTNKSRFNKTNTPQPPDPLFSKEPYQKAYLENQISNLKKKKKPISTTTNQPRKASRPTELSTNNARKPSQSSKAIL